MSVVLFTLGLVLLIAGAEALVRGASRIASSLGVSSLVIGLTVVAFGTSAPELAVSVKASLAGQANIAVGNVIGSNIFNVLFILGVSALIVPLVVAQQLIRLDVPLMVGLSFAVLVLALDRDLDRIDGLMLVTTLGLYLAFLIYQSRKEGLLVQAEISAEVESVTRANGSKLKDLAMIGGGLGLLVLGSKWLVDSSVVFAQYLGISELIIGLTIVAAGTSLPEVVTSIIAAIRGERDIAVGNIVGSNIFNILSVLGVASIVAPGGIEIAPSVLRFDIPVMIAVAFACLPIFFGGIITRAEGALLLGYYIAYTLYLVLAATHHEALPEYSATLLYFVLPLTFVTLLMLAVRHWRRG